MTESVLLTDTQGNPIGAPVNIPVATPSATFTRPADTTAYASGDLVANSTTAGSVVPMQFTVGRQVGSAFSIRGAKLKKSGVTLTNASFRLHLYVSDPSLSAGIANGDNGAWSTTESAWIGSIDITIDKAFSDAAAGFATVTVPFSRKLTTGQVIFALLEARASYTPVSGEVFTAYLDVVSN